MMTNEEIRAEAFEQKRTAISREEAATLRLVLAVCNLVDMCAHLKWLGPMSTQPDTPSNIGTDLSERTISPGGGENE